MMDVCIKKIKFNKQIADTLSKNYYEIPQSLITDNFVKFIIDLYTVVGNIFDCKENIICHQVNMQKKMGSGIAKQIRERYPEVYSTYMNHEPIIGDVHIIPTNDGSRWIANMYSQNNYGYDGKQYTNYDAMRKCFKDISNHIVLSNKCGNSYSLAIPYKIGCGLGGGDWNVVSRIIVELLRDISYTIYKLEK